MKPNLPSKGLRALVYAALAALFLCMSAPLVIAKTAADAFKEAATRAVMTYVHVDAVQGRDDMRKVAMTGPDALEAVWLAAYAVVSVDYNSKVAERAAAVMAGTPVALAVAEIAREQQQVAMHHYVMARLADIYHAYDRALAEIDKAIAAAPREGRYFRTRAVLLLEQGHWERSELLVHEAVAAFDHAVSVVTATPTTHTSPGDLYFRLARRYPRFMPDTDAQQVRFYERALASGDLDRNMTAYAWNNISSPLRELGDCQRAKEAAEKALAIFDFGNARANLEYATVCLDFETVPSGSPSDGTLKVSQ